jgi:hypothetical protein
MPCSFAIGRSTTMRPAAWAPRTLPYALPSDPPVQDPQKPKKTGTAGASGSGVLNNRDAPAGPSSRSYHEARASYRHDVAGQALTEPGPRSPDRHARTRLI